MAKNARMRFMGMFLCLSALFVAGCSSVNIIQPRDGEAFRAGRVIQFEGEITRSLETGGADRSDRLRWSSSIDGHIGDGRRVSTDILSIGSHAITASWPNHNRDESVLIRVNP